MPRRAPAHFASQPAAVPRWLLALALCGSFAIAAEPPPRVDLEAARAETQRLAAEGKWQDVLTTGETLLEACRRDLGAENPATARADLWLGEARQHLGTPALAESHFRRALAIQEKTLARHDPALAITLTHLASALKAQQRTAEAAPLLERALTLQREVLGPEHPDTALGARNLAVLYKLQGDYDRALPLYEETLAIRRRVLGTGDPATLSSLRELGEFYEQRGDLASAEKCAAERAAALERADGGESAELAAALSDWGAIAVRQERFADADAPLRRALAIQEKLLDAADVRLAPALSALGVCLRQLGRFEEAAPLLERALDLRITTLGAAHAETAASSRELGWLRCMQGDRDAAQPLLENALAVRERALGEAAPETLESLADLAELYRVSGALDRAESLLISRRQRIERTSGADSLEATAASRDLAAFYESTQRWKPAIAAAEHAYTLHLARLGPGDPRTLAALTFFARLCTAGGESARAVEQFARLAPWFEQHPKSDPKAHAEWLRQSAIATLHAGQKADAERLFVASRKWHESKFGPNDPATLRSLGDLWTFYTESEQPARAVDPARELAARSAESLGADAPATLVVFERLAQLQSTLGQRGEALGWWQRALDGTRRHFGADAPETLDALAHLAAWHEDSGEFTKAAPLRAERLQLIERTAGRESDAAKTARDAWEACRRKAAKTP